MKKNKVIAFDIGGVLMEVDFMRSLHAFGFQDMSQINPSLRQGIALFERGRVSREEFFAACRENIRADLTNLQVIDYWNRCLGKPIAQMKEVLQRFIEKGYRIVLFSDTSEFHMNCIYRTHPFIHLASGAVLSFETGAKKPENAMYERFERDYGIPLLYIDDRRENVRGGEKHHWQSHLFRNCADLAAWKVENIPEWEYIVGLNVPT